MADTPSSTPAPNVLAFPTKVKRSFEGHCPIAELPENAVSLATYLPRYTPPEKLPIPATGLLVLALVEAIRDKRPGRHLIDKTMDALVSGMRRLGDDHEVLARYRVAFNMLCGYRSGRYSNDLCH